DELSNLRARSGHERQQRAVHGTRLAYEEFDDARYALPDQDGKGQTAMQTQPCGNRRAREIWIGDDVGDPRRLRCRPDAAWQADASLKPPLATVGHELVHTAGALPAVHVLQGLLPIVDLPEDPDIPKKRVAHGLQDWTSGALQVETL